jgi:hypothetical protein
LASQPKSTTVLALQANPPEPACLKNQAVGVDRDALSGLGSRHRIAPPLKFTWAALRRCRAGCGGMRGSGQTPRRTAAAVQEAGGLCLLLALRGLTWLRHLASTQAEKTAAPIGAGASRLEAHAGHSTVTLFARFLVFVSGRRDAP